MKKLLKHKTDWRIMAVILFTMLLVEFLLIEWAKAETTCDSTGTLCQTWGIIQP